MIYEVVGGLAGPTEAVRIFIQFVRQEAAIKAYIDLNGRFFGGRSVSASFYSEERFTANDLTPNNEELEQINQAQT
jgi:splicing factor 45